MQPPRQKTRAPLCNLYLPRLHTVPASRGALSGHQLVAEGSLPEMAAGKRQHCLLAGCRPCLRPMLVVCRISRPKSNVGVSYGPGCSNALVPRIRDNGVYLQRKLSLGPRLNGRALKPPQGPRGSKVRLGVCRSKRLGLSDGQRRMSPPPTTSNAKIAIILTQFGQSMCRVCKQLLFLSHNRIHNRQRRDNRSRTRPCNAETKNQGPSDLATPYTTGAPHWPRPTYLRTIRARAEVAPRLPSF